MLNMKEKGANTDDLDKTKTYLDRVRKIDEAYVDYAMLLVMYRELSIEVKDGK